MKRLLITGVSVLALGLAGCGSDTTDDTGKENSDIGDTPVQQPLQPATGGIEDKSAEDSETDATTDSTTDAAAGDTQADMEQLSFKEIEVEVSYGDDKEYEAEIEQDNNEPIKAKVEDELNDVYLKDQEAFDDLYPKVKNLDLTKDSSDQATIDQVLDIFDLQADYEKFEVEIKFNDGSKLEVEDRK